MYFVFLSSYANTRECLGELEKAVKTLACGCFIRILKYGVNLQHENEALEQIPL